MANLQQNSGAELHISGQRVLWDENTWRDVAARRQTGSTVWLSMWLISVTVLAGLKFLNFMF